MGLGIQITLSNKSSKIIIIKKKTNALTVPIIAPRIRFQ